MTSDNWPNTNLNTKCTIFEANSLLFQKHRGYFNDFALRYNRYKWRHRHMEYTQRRRLKG